MNLLIYARWTLDVNVPPAEAARLLSEQVRPPRTWMEYLRATYWRSVDTVPFEGNVTSQSFKIKRLITYRNSFLPIILGRFEATPTGTRIAITCRTHLFTIGLMICWIGILLPIGFSLRHQGGGQMPLGMALFGFTLWSMTFNLERIKARDLLLKILSEVL